MSYRKKVFNPEERRFYDNTLKRTRRGAKLTHFLSPEEILLYKKLRNRIKSRTWRENHPKEWQEYNTKKQREYRARKAGDNSPLAEVNISGKV